MTRSSLLSLALLALLGCDDKGGDLSGEDGSGGEDGSPTDDSGEPEGDDTGDSEPEPVDADGDGFTGEDGDCDDSDPTAYPGGAEICDDGVDNDCDAETTCGLAGPVQASDADLQIEGDLDGDEAGFALVAVADIGDHDERPDFLVGAPGSHESGFANAGRVSLVSSAFIEFADTGTSFSGVSYARYRGSVAQGRLGSSVDAQRESSSIPAVLLGAPGAGGLVEGAGSALLFEEAEAGVHSASDADGLFRGDEAGDEAGAAVRLAEDYDGDSALDAFVGAPGRGGGAGAVWLLRGPLLGALEENATLLTGDTEGERVGSALLVADIDGSGDADALVGAPGGSGVYLLRDGEIPASLADAERFAGSAGSGLGAALAAQDLDGDGELDILVGAPLGGYVAVLSADLAEVARCTSSEAGDSAGFSVSGAGDIDGDGLGDLLVGAPLAEGGGAVYALYGPISPGCALQDEAAFSLHGDTALGTSVLGGLQLDGAAGDDILVGDSRALSVDPKDPEKGESSGIVSLVFTHGP